MEHYLEAFYPQAIATGQQLPAVVPALASAPPDAEAIPKMTVDMDLIGKIDRQDLWI